MNKPSLAQVFCENRCEPCLNLRSPYQPPDLQFLENFTSTLITFSSEKINKQFLQNIDGILCPSYQIIRHDFFFHLGWINCNWC